VKRKDECIALEKRGDKLAVNVDCSSGDETVMGSHALLAVGRVPNTVDLGLESTGVAVDQRGYIKVDDQLRTNVPGIYALAIATDEELSLIPRTTTTRLSPPIFWKVTSAA
jgi:pyruvate/2-oxoglutarate dehydrogenase complex dihydrolipoamide dehydrogenase (E3) component